MKHAYSLFFSATLPAALLAALSFSVACSNQSEGGRCDPNNNDDDCASGLSCQKIQGQESALCCPPASKPASVSACIPGQSMQQTDSGAKDAPSGSTSDSAASDSASGDGNGDEPIGKVDADNDSAERDSAESDTNESDTNEDEDSEADPDAEA